MVEQRDRFRTSPKTRRAGGALGLSVALLTLLAPAVIHSQAVSCDSARIDSVQTGDDTLDLSKCGGYVPRLRDEGDGALITPLGSGV